MILVALFQFFGETVRNNNKKNLFSRVWKICVFFMQPFLKTYFSYNKKSDTKFHTPPNPSRWSNVKSEFCLFFIFFENEKFDFCGNMKKVGKCDCAVPSRKINENFLNDCLFRKQWYSMRYLKKCFNI